MLISGIYTSSGSSIFGGGSTKVSSASSFGTSDFITPTLPMALSLTYFVNEATFGALDEMRSPMTVAQNRGVSLDVVFNG